MRNTGRLVLLFCLVVVLVTIGLVNAQIRSSGGPPNPAPPNAAVVECGQQVLTAPEFQSFAEIMRAAGCTHTEFDYIWDGFYIGRGTKIVVTP